MDAHALSWDGPVRVALTGDMDLATVDEAHRTLRAAMQHSCPVVALDLSAVDFMDCSGLSVIVEARAQARHAGGDLTVVAASAQVRRLFALTHVTATLDLPPTTRPGAGRT